MTSSASAEVTPEPRRAGNYSDRLKRRLAQRQHERGRLSAERRAYRQAACLLARFDPTVLRLPDRDDVGGAVLALVDDSIALGGGSGRTWTLKPEVRTEALRSLDGAEAALHAVRANTTTDAREPEGAALRLLTGASPPLTAQDHQELSATLQAVLWLQQVPGVEGLPREDDIRLALERRRLREPLEALVRGAFLGRERELDELRAHVGVLAPVSLRGRVKAAHREVRSWMRDDGATRPPLLVHGPGGIGKSTLLARFLLEHLDGPTRPLPFAQIDFQRASVTASEPLTVMAEVATQLAVQLSSMRERLVRVAEECRDAARQQRAEQAELDELQELATTRASRGREASRKGFERMRAEESALVTHLGRAVAEAQECLPEPGSRDPVPLLLVLDSFEEAQYRDSPVLGRLWAVFQALQNSYPMTRVVVAGRAPVDHPAAPARSLPTLALEELDTAAAVGFLAAHGVTDPELASAVAARVGGNPLTLKLAAGLVVRMTQQGSPSTWVRGLPSRKRWLLRSLDDTVVQGMLYDRILGHIDDPEVRRLAHPGLVLRSVTPALLQDVLASECGLPDLDEAGAARLFDTLRRELDLVEETAAGALRHRPDVRRVMLRLLAVDRPEAVRRVERRAVEYYSRSDEVQDRAEELYHRLRLGDDRSTLAARWLDGVEDYLRDALDELPPRGAAFLAARLGPGITTASLVDADQEDREVVVAREVEGLLSQGYVDEALDRMRQVQRWTVASPLHPLHVEALLHKGDLIGARRVVDAALDAPESQQDVETRLELLLLSARVAEQEGHVDAADADLRLAERLAATSEREAEAVGVLLERALLHHRTGEPDDEVDEQLARHIRALPAPELLRRPTLLRRVAAEVGAHHSGVLAHVLALVGLPVQGPAAVEQLADDLLRAVESRPALAHAVESALGTSGSEAGLRQRVARALDEARARGDLDQVADALVHVADESGAVRATLARAVSRGLGASGTAVPSRQRPPGAEATRPSTEQEWQ